MGPNQNPPPDAAPISIDLRLNQLIQRIDSNVQQQIIVTTADKAKLCLIETLDRMERRRAWIAPAGMAATLAVVFPTTDFRGFMGFQKEYWQATFALALLGSIFWLVWALIRMRKSLSVDEIVNRLRTDSLSSAAKPD